MRREAQLKAAMKLLRPHTVVDDDKCVKWLTMALDAIDLDRRNTQQEKDTGSKAALSALAVYRAALLRAAGNYANLPVGMKEKLDHLGRLEEASTPNFRALIAVCDKALALAQHPTRAEFNRFSSGLWAKTVLEELGITPTA